MTVTYMGELDSARSAKNTRGKRSYTRAFRLETDSRSDSAYTVGSHASLPVIGSIHPDDPAAYVDDISIDNTDPWKGWTATYQYTTERSFDQSDPENDEVLVSWTSEIYQEPVFKDNNGNAILNSAGDYFLDPVPARDASHLIARIRKNVTSIPIWVLTYQNAVNNSAISIAGLPVAAGQAKLQRIDIGERQKRGNSIFYEIAFEIHLHANGWKLEPLDAGFRRKDDEGKRVQITNDGDNEPVTSPALLNGEGGLLSNPSPVTAVYGDFDVYPERNFSILPGIA